MQLRSLLVPSLLVLASGMASADVTLPLIFGDHMVLQRDASVPVWGWADPGEKVTVAAGSSTASTTAAQDGKWTVKLEKLPVSKTPIEVTVEGKNKIVLKDVLIGDVWICSGQSNMEFPLSGALKASAEIPKANDPQLRLFRVRHKVALQPETNVEGSWEICTPDTVKSFSAVGYFFGRELRSALNCPMGLIQSAWGGTPAQAWTSLSGLQKEPTLNGYVEKQQQNAATYPKLVQDYPALLAAFKEASAKWEANEGVQYQASMKEWEAASAKAKAAGQSEPPKPVVPAKPPIPKDPSGGPGGPSNLFNGMIAPLIPYAIKGAIWYQGEANAGNGPEYRTLFGRMITDWREHWGEGDFPFLFVQLASFDSGSIPWSFLREAQLKTLALPKTGMASAVDLGDFHSLKNIHPRDKSDVGLRLALAAKHVAYGQTLVYSGPLYDSSKVEGGAIRVHFTQTGGGLQISSPPWIDETPAQPWTTDKLIGFEIAGEDGNYVPADAKIDGNSVIVSNPQVSLPVFVRYAWSNLVWANLYNKEGLPAAPFRTDNQLPVILPRPAASTPSPIPSATASPR